MEYCAQLGLFQPTLKKWIVRSGLAWAKARPWPKRLSRQTQGGWVRTKTFLIILRNNSPTCHPQIALIVKPRAT